jgi:hypothetical protein
MQKKYFLTLVSKLQTGMQISVFRNGELWKAQVIIPKTTMSCVDLAPSNNKVSKIVLICNKY